VAWGVGRGWSGGASYDVIIQWETEQPPKEGGALRTLVSLSYCVVSLIGARWLGRTPCAVRGTDPLRAVQRHSRMPNVPDQKAAPAKMNIQYLSGKVQGDMVRFAPGSVQPVRADRAVVCAAQIYETVTLGDIQVDGQVVGLGKVVDIELLDDVKWDGILGLAYPNPALTAQGITPIFDTIINSVRAAAAASASHAQLNLFSQGVLTKKGLSNQFAYYISDHKGSVTFGGADCDLVAKGDKANCISKFQFVPVTEKTYWTVTLRDVRVKFPNGQTKSAGCGPTGCKAIVDTGTYLIYGPDRQVNSMMTSGLSGCASLSHMPTFEFEFKTHDGSQKMELKPEDYVLKFNLAGRDDCVVGISPDKDTIWTLGQVFLRSFYTVFDRDADRIGFARLPRDGFPAINAPDTVAKAVARADEREKRLPPTNKKIGFMQRMRSVETKRLKSLDKKKAHAHHAAKHHHHEKKHHHHHHKKHDDEDEDRFRQHFAELRHAPAHIEEAATVTESRNFDGPRHVHFERQGNL
jgi:hypothetical protein